MPGDIIIADDDGAVVVPIALAPEAGKEGRASMRLGGLHAHELAQGGHLRKYYPLNEDAQAEYQAWRKTQNRPDGPRGRE